jgi:hypothetical protein
MSSPVYFMTTGFARGARGADDVDGRGGIEERPLSVLAAVGCEFLAHRGWYPSQPGPYVVTTLKSGF